MGGKGKELEDAEDRPKFEDSFLQVLIGKVREGKLQSSTFKKEVWSEINGELCDIIGQDYGVESLKVKFNRLRIKYRLFSELLGHTGVKWDVTTNVAHPSQQIREELKKNRGFRVFQGQDWRNYEFFREMFNTTTAIRMLQHLSTVERGSRFGTQELRLEEDFAFDTIHLNFDAKNLEVEGDAKGEKRSTDSSECRDPKVNKMDEMESFLDRWLATPSANEEAYEANAETYRVFKGQGWPNYELLREIFNTTTATGKLQQLSAEESGSLFDTQELCLEEDFAFDTIHLNFDAENLEVEGDAKGEKRSMDSSECRDPKVNKMDEMEPFLDRWPATPSANEEAYEANAETYRMMNDDDALQPGENMGEEGREKKVESALIMQSEEENIKDKENKEDHCSKACSAVSSKYEPYLHSERRYKMWYWVEIKLGKQRDEQIAFLADVLKCDKSKVRSMHEFSDLWAFYAFLTEEEAQKLSELEMVDYIRRGRPRRIRREQTKSRRKINAGPKIKEQKLSLGSRLSEQRKNKGKWRYDEDLELKVAKEESEDEYCSSDSSGACNEIEYYLPLDAAGKRWYQVSLVNDIKPDDQEALLLATLNCSDSEIPSIYESSGFHHTFDAYMTEEDADKVAGLEEVEFVQPHRCMIGLE